MGYGIILNLLKKRVNQTFTPEGGVVIELVNKTGADSVKGQVVKASFAHDNAFDTATEDSVIPVGVVYDADVADGQVCRVVVSGIAEVLMKNDVESVRGNWVGTSDVAGRGFAGGGEHPGKQPPEQALHNQELGHCLESKAAGTDVLAKIVMHFN